MVHLLQPEESSAAEGSVCKAEAGECQDEACPDEECPWVTAAVGVGLWARAMAGALLGRHGASLMCFNA